MEQVVTGNSANYEVHFLNSDDPRHDFTVMSTNPPTYYDFRTPIGYRETHTIVRVDSSPPNPCRLFTVSAQVTCN
jgi:hypothetical protein